MHWYHIQTQGDMVYSLKSTLPDVMKNKNIWYFETNHVFVLDQTEVFPMY